MRFTIFLTVREGNLQAYIPSTHLSFLVFSHVTSFSYSRLRPSENGDRSITQPARLENWILLNFELIWIQYTDNSGTHNYFFLFFFFINSIFCFIWLLINQPFDKILLWEKIQNEIILYRVTLQYSQAARCGNPASDEVFLGEESTRPWRLLGAHPTTPEECNEAK